MGRLFSFYIKQEKNIEDKENSVSYCFEPLDEWNLIDNRDLWVYNKLFLSRVLGYNCGPSGVPVPKPDFYVVRPSMNLMGMGRLSRIEYIQDNTDHLHPSEFWCEVFDGDHLSVDYYCEECNLVVRGIRNPNDSLYKWLRWEKVNKIIEFPSILKTLNKFYEWINCEFIGNNLIEVHFRRNPDFRYGNTIAIPVWNDDVVRINSKYKYIEDQDYFRKGFLIDRGIETP
jgi:hypothetical protein